MNLICNNVNPSSWALKLTLFLSPSVSHSGHPPEGRLFCQRRRPTRQIQSGEGRISLGPQQWLCGLRAQHQWPAVPRRGERDPRRPRAPVPWTFPLTRCSSSPPSLCKSALACPSLGLWESLHTAQQADNLSSSVSSRFDWRNTWMSPTSRF